MFRVKKIDEIEMVHQIIEKEGLDVCNRRVPLNRKSQVNLNWTTPNYDGEMILVVINGENIYYLDDDFLVYKDVRRVMGIQENSILILDGMICKNLFMRDHICIVHDLVNDEMDYVKRMECMKEKLERMKLKEILKVAGEEGLDNCTMIDGTLYQTANSRELRKTMKSETGTYRFDVIALRSGPSNFDLYCPTTRGRYSMMSFAKDAPMEYDEGMTDDRIRKITNVLSSNNKKYLLNLHLKVTIYGHTWVIHNATAIKWVSEKKKIGNVQNLIDILEGCLHMTNPIDMKATAINRLTMVVFGNNKGGMWLKTDEDRNVKLEQEDQGRVLPKDVRAMRIYYDVQVRKWRIFECYSKIDQCQVSNLEDMVNMFIETIKQNERCIY